MEMCFAKLYDLIGEVVTFTRLKATVSANEKSIYFCAMTNSGLILEGPHEKVQLTYPLLKALLCNVDKGQHCSRECQTGIFRM